VATVHEKLKRDNTEPHQLAIMQREVLKVSREARRGGLPLGQPVPHPEQLPAQDPEIMKIDEIVDRVRRYPRHAAVSVMTANAEAHQTLQTTMDRLASVQRALTSHEPCDHVAWMGQIDTVLVALRAALDLLDAGNDITAMYQYGDHHEGSEQSEPVLPMIIWMLKESERRSLSKDERATLLRAVSAQVNRTGPLPGSRPGVSSPEESAHRRAFRWPRHWIENLGSEHKQLTSILKRRKRAGRKLANAWGVPLVRGESAEDLLHKRAPSAVSLCLLAHAINETPRTLERHLASLRLPSPR
jgi:hypothetical protein